MLFRSNDTATTEIYTTANTLSLHDALPILVAFLLSVLAAIAFFFARRQSSEDMTPVRSARQFTRAVGTVKEQLR